MNRDIEHAMNEHEVAGISEMLRDIEDVADVAELLIDGWLRSGCDLDAEWGRLQGEADILEDERWQALADAVDEQLAEFSDDDDTWE